MVIRGEVNARPPWPRQNLFVPSIAGALQIEVIGARLIGPAPIEDLWIPVEPGVHALYGKNGAGKSRILRALANLYSCGEESTGYLVGRVMPGGVRGHDRQTAFSYLHVDGADFRRGLDAPRDWVTGHGDWHYLVAESLWPVCAEFCGESMPSSTATQTNISTSSTNSSTTLTR